MSQSSAASCAIELPWLAPGADALAALARPASADAWLAIRSDPFAVALLFRQFPPDSRPGCPSHEQRLATLACADRYWDSTGGFLDWNRPSCSVVAAHGLRCAATAEQAARLSGRVDPETACLIGLLTPLGWWAVIAADAGAADACLRSPDLATDPRSTQARCWGLDHAQVVARLCRRWGFPQWLSRVLANLDLPVEVAAACGADPGLFAAVQLGAALAEQGGAPLGTLAAPDPEAPARHLGLSREVLHAGPTPSPPSWRDPRANPLTRELVRLAAERSDDRGSRRMVELEEEVDLLRGRLVGQGGDEKNLRDARLESLAEMAAGASHEINNPLAVISGQGQYLLVRETDPDRQKSLRTIVRQAQRIHQVLTELMRFARPAAPQVRAVDPLSVVREVVAELRELGHQRRVTVEITQEAGEATLLADPPQLHLALGCLVRNAVEAAGPDGWVRVSFARPGPAAIEFVVEDSGPGPGEAQVRHMFDPFYSGRQAGRGKGLGLPTAWRIARDHGGEVRHVPTPGGPTRFVLRLPLASNASPPEALPDRLSA